MQSVPGFHPARGRLATIPLVVSSSGIACFVVPFLLKRNGSAAGWYYDFSRVFVLALIVGLVRCCVAGTRGYALL